MEVEQRKTKYAELNIELLEIDDAYQRHLASATVNRIAREFSWSRFGTIEVGMRGTRVYVVDGHHRISALRLLGYCGTVPCMVTPSSTRESEARDFGGQVARRGLTPYDLWRAGIAARDERYLAAQDVLDRLGLIASNNSREGGRLRAISSFLQVFDTDRSRAEVALTLSAASCVAGEQISHLAIFGYYGLAHVDNASRIPTLDDANRVRKMGGMAEISARTLAIAAMRKTSVSRHSSAWRMPAAAICQMINYRKHHNLISISERAVSTGD